MFKQMVNPDLYHGRNSMRDFFEGWYFKVVDRSGKYSFALIPGVFWGKQENEHHAFLQILDGKDVSYQYITLPTSAFRTTDRPFAVVLTDVGKFTLQGFSVTVQTQQCNIEGELSFTYTKRWSDSWLSPGSMGAYNFIPGMQCYSQVCAMEVGLSGELMKNGETISFDGGKGYIEKNWGRAFPYSWIWIQSNHFRHSDAAVSCSIGHIPLLWTSFRGFLIGLYLDDTFYEFTTMNGSKMEIVSTNPDMEIHVSNKKHRLRIQTSCRPETFILCRGPRNGEMVPMVEECLQGQLEVSLHENESGICVWSDKADATGLEYGGDQMKIIDELLRKDEAASAKEKNSLQGPRL